MPFGARRTFGVVPISKVEFAARRAEDIAQSDYIDRDRILSLPPGQQMRFYARKGLLEDLKRIVKIKAGGLVECECSVDEPDKGGWTALHIAAYEDFVDVVAWLIKAKCNVDPETTGGFTPLYLAVTNGSEDSVKVLKEHNAQYEWSSGQGTVFRNRFLARTLKDPSVPQFKKVRTYREVRHFEVKNPHGQSPYTSTALYPQGQELSYVAHDFAIQGAANRYAHPAATYLGGMWKTHPGDTVASMKANGTYQDGSMKAVLNEGLLKRSVPGGPRWRDNKVERFKASSSSSVLATAASRKLYN